MGLFKKAIDNLGEKLTGYKTVRLSAEEMAEKVYQIFIEPTQEREFLEELQACVKGPSLFAEYATKSITTANERFKLELGIWDITPFWWPTLLDSLYHKLNPKMPVNIYDAHSMTAYTLERTKHYKKFYAIVAPQIKEAIGDK